MKWNYKTLHYNNNDEEEMGILLFKEHPDKLSLITKYYKKK